MALASNKLLIKYSFVTVAFLVASTRTCSTYMTSQELR
jgi:hypothetical protein